MPFPLSVSAALRQQQEIVDRLSDRAAAGNLEDARHELAVLEAFVGVLRHRRYIVRQQNAALLRCPL
jgi:hypothetical protein